VQLLEKNVFEPKKTEIKLSFVVHIVTSLIILNDKKNDLQHEQLPNKIEFINLIELISSIFKETSSEIE